MTKTVRCAPDNSKSSPFLLHAGLGRKVGKIGHVLSKAFKNQKPKNRKSSSARLHIGRHPRVPEVDNQDSSVGGSRGVKHHTMFERVVEEEGLAQLPLPRHPADTDLCPAYLRCRRHGLESGRGERERERGGEASGGKKRPGCHNPRTSGVYGWTHGGVGVHSVPAATRAWCGISRTETQAKANAPPCSAS